MHPCYGQTNRRIDRQLSCLIIDLFLERESKRALFAVVTGVCVNCSTTPVTSATQAVMRLRSLLHGYSNKPSDNLTKILK